MPQFPVRADTESAAFLEGTARGEFLIVRDRTTGEYLDPKFDVDTDPDRYERVIAAGTGDVVTWSVVHGKGADGPVRNVVAIVQLDEGLWWWTELVGVDPDADLLGLKVHAEFVPTGAGEHDAVIPQFRPE
jgi:uncharacterized OB-fold protein